MIGVGYKALCDNCLYEDSGQWGISLDRYVANLMDRGWVPVGNQMYCGKRCAPTRPS